MESDPAVYPYFDIYPSKAAETLEEQVGSKLKDIDVNHSSHYPSFNICRFSHGYSLQMLINVLFRSSRLFQFQYLSRIPGHQREKIHQETAYQGFCIPVPCLQSLHVMFGI